MIRILIILLCITTNIYASDNKKDRSQIRIGIYITALYNFNYEMGTFSSSYYLWTVSKNKDYNPMESIEIVNAIDYKGKNEYKGVNPDGTYFTTFHVYSTNLHDWNIKYFPFDTQKLYIKVEDADDIEDVKYVPDTEESGISYDVKMEGWKVVGINYFVEPFKYDTNFGDAKSDYSLYSRYHAEITIKRDGARIFVNYFIGFIVSLILSALIFFIDPKEIGARSGYSLSSIFAAVGNKYIIDSKLPTVSQFTLVDAIQFLSFSQVLLAVFITLIAYHWVSTEQLAKARKLSRIAGFIIVPFVVISFTYFLVGAIFS